MKAARRKSKITKGDEPPFDVIRSLLSVPMPLAMLALRVGILKCTPQEAVVGLGIPVQPLALKGWVREARRRGALG